MNSLNIEQEVSDNMKTFDISTPGFTRQIAAGLAR